MGQKPSVGMAGLTLGGGFGFTTRYAGLLCDRLVSLEARDAPRRFSPACVVAGVLLCIIIRLPPLRGVTACCIANHATPGVTRVRNTKCKTLPALGNRAGYGCQNHRYQDQRIQGKTGNQAAEKLRQA